MTNISCPWSLFNDGEMKALDEAIDITGIISCLLSLWFILAYFFTSLKDNWSYYNIGCFFMAAWIRRFAPVILNYVFLNRNGKLPQDMRHCERFAFVETFLAVHEIECLTHICIERFVVAKYICNGWVMPRKHYVMFRLLCLLFAGVYSVAPLVGVGRYGLDFSCTSCTMDVILAEGWSKPYAALVFALRSIKPAGFMYAKYTNTVNETIYQYLLRIFMLIGCKSYESSYDDSETHQLQRRITRDAIAVTFVSLACWTPVAAVRGWALLTQLFGPGVLLPAAGTVKWALLLHWNSLTPAVVALFALDREIRAATLRLRPGHVLGQTTDKKDQ